MALTLSRNPEAVQGTDQFVKSLILMLFLAAPLAASSLTPPRFAFEVLGHTLPKGTVALTFDDGPHRQHTPALLELLARHRAPASFFMLGQNARLLPGVAREVAAAGHAVGAHSMDHQKLTPLSDEALQAQIVDSQRLVAEAIGRPVRLFRCPYGARDARVIRAIDAAQMRHILWNVDSRDWQDRDPERTAQRVLAALLAQEKGAVVVLHDIHPTSIAATARLLDLIAPLRASGALRLVSLDQVLW